MLYFNCRTQIMSHRSLQSRSKELKYRSRSWRIKKLNNKQQDWWMVQKWESAQRERERDTGNWKVMSSYRERETVTCWSQSQCCAVLRSADRQLFCFRFSVSFWAYSFGLCTGLCWICHLFLIGFLSICPSLVIQVSFPLSLSHILFLFLMHM